MFAGIIESVGTVVAVREFAGGRRLSIDLMGLENGLSIGASVSISGACLTICTLNSAVAEFDAVTETLRRTTLGSLATGNRVNLERSLRVGDRIDGHFVQGHVDGLAAVESIEDLGSGQEIWFRPPSHLRSFLIIKGSITLDGVSLTIAEVAATGSFRVALIPTTLARTTLCGLREGDFVNVESDILSRIIIQRLDSYLQSKTDELPRCDGLAMSEFLSQEAFIAVPREQVAE